MFVFFALLINVGLLVHHKINLQQSADMAAYYGAMKQAEMLNTIAHVNFQIRQAWKLLAWRYRVLGTAGMQHSSNPSNQIDFPIDIKALGSNSTEFVYNANSAIKKCPSALGNLGIEDVPFFCIGFVGFRGWLPDSADPGASAAESFCKVDCNHINNIPTTINKVAGVGNASIYGNSIAGAINTAIDKANDNIRQRCSDLGSKDLNILATFLKGYINEVQARSQTIEMLQANLSSGIDHAVDLDGGLIKTGIKKTFENNLTEANKTGEMTMQAFTSNEAECKKFLNPILFQFVQFYLNSCVYTGTGTDTYTKSSIRPTYLYDEFGKINTSTDELKMITKDPIPLDLQALVNAVQGKMTVGYEKNPWCTLYVAVKSTSKPKIPFLPISQIQLSATSVAKPFGGSVGPWFKKTWEPGSPESQQGDTATQDQQTDYVLPKKVLNNNPSLNQATRVLPNFSKFVGDKVGLADVKYMASYHAALLTRKLDGSFYNAIKDPNLTAPPGLSQPTRWPAMNLWQKSIDETDSNYDPLALEYDSGSPRISYMRAVELAAIAPNQFDATYYSIEPDFYNNYYVKLKKNFNAIQGASGLSVTSDILRPDFGASIKDNSSLKSLTDTSGLPVLEQFSVKDQIRVFAKVFGEASLGIIGSGAPPRMIDAYPENLKKQSSLLTGWTFLNLADYDTFPAPATGLPNSTSTMTFGMCANDWNKTDGTTMNELYGAPTDAAYNGLPPTPGNCVTGGRTGYSVKLVSPAAMRTGAEPQQLGGSGVSGNILNPLPESFFNF